MQPSIFTLTRLSSSRCCGSTLASAATCIASSSRATVDARSVLPERSASIALLRTMLMSQVMGVAIAALYPLALCQTFMKASCSTSSARSRLFNIRNETPKRCAQVAR